MKDRNRDEHACRIGCRATASNNRISFTEAGSSTHERTLKSNPKGSTISGLPAGY